MGVKVPVGVACYSWCRSINEGAPYCRFGLQIRVTHGIVLSATEKPKTRQAHDSPRCPHTTLRLATDIRRFTELKATLDIPTVNLFGYQRASPNLGCCLR